MCLKWLNEKMLSHAVTKRKKKQMNNNQHNEELSSMAPKLSAIAKRELHKCPEGYFDGLCDQVLSKIKESPVLNAVEKKEPYEAPEGYFDTLSEKVLAKISERITRLDGNEAPVLFSLEKKELFEAPEGYFESLKVESILQPVKQVRLPARAGSDGNDAVGQAKIVPIRTSILRWTAVAASVAVIIMASVYLFSDNTVSTKTTAVVETTQEEYTNYLMDELQEDELYAYVSESQPVVNDSTDAVVDYLIDESSDYELEEY
jgi:hypothetical protein